MDRRDFLHLGVANCIGLMIGIPKSRYGTDLMQIYLNRGPIYFNLRCTGWSGKIVNRIIETQFWVRTEPKNKRHPCEGSLFFGASLWWPEDCKSMGFTVESDGVVVNEGKSCFYGVNGDHLNLSYHLSYGHSGTEIVETFPELPKDHWLRGGMRSKSKALGHLGPKGGEL